MDIQPINAGHVLVIPTRHASCLAELEAGCGPRMFELGQRIALAIRGSQLPCEGINLFLADGEAAGQVVFHVHLHVVPRFRGDGFGLRFGPNYGTQADREALDRLATAIRGRLERPPT